MEIHVKSLLKKKTNYFIKIIRMLIRNFYAHKVGENSAALAYYILFAIFPLLIFISNLIGLMHIDMKSIIPSLSYFIPKDVVIIVENYLVHVQNTARHSLLWFSLVFSILFPMRAVKGLMLDVRMAFGYGKLKRPVTYKVYQVIYTVFFLIVLAASLFLSTIGQNFLLRILAHIPNNLAFNSQRFLTIWQFVRFVPVAILMFSALSALYILALEGEKTLRSMLPGIWGALIAWLVVSISFSFYTENFANYSDIYGTLGTVIVLMVWLYISSVILILGAEFNAAILTLRKENA